MKYYLNNFLLNKLKKMSQDKKKADNNNNANQLNKNNPEYGNARNNQTKPPAENTKQKDVPKENENKENLKP